MQAQFLSGAELAGLFGLPSSTIYRALKDRRLTPAGRTRREVLFVKERAIDYARSLGRYLDGDTYFGVLLKADAIQKADETEIAAYELSSKTILSDQGGTESPAPRIIAGGVEAADLNGA